MQLQNTTRSKRLAAYKNSMEIGVRSYIHSSESISRNFLQRSRAHGMHSLLLRSNAHSSSGTKATVADQLRTDQSPM